MSLFSVNHHIIFIVLYFTVSPRSSEEIDRLSEVKNLTARLYSQLNVEEHQLRRERDTIQRLEEYKRQIAPMELVTWLLLSSTLCIQGCGNSKFFYLSRDK